MTNEEALNAITAFVENYAYGNDLIGLKMAIEALKEERPHGEWLSHYDYCKKHEFIPTGLIAFWWCNQCEQGVEIKTNFCPNCGASMRKEGEKE